jgi:hypothetical protein
MNTGLKIIDSQSNTSSSGESYLGLSKITVNEDYRKKWNIIQHDFVCLTKNGELLRDTLYRVGLMEPNLNKDDYFMLLKHVEAFYPRHIMDISKKIMVIIEALIIYLANGLL